MVLIIIWGEGNIVVEIIFEISGREFAGDSFLAILYAARSIFKLSTTSQLEASVLVRVYFPGRIKNYQQMTARSLKEYFNDNNELGLGSSGTCELDGVTQSVSRLSNSDQRS